MGAWVPRYNSKLLYAGPNDDRSLLTLSGCHAVTPLLGAAGVLNPPPVPWSAAT